MASVKTLANFVGSLGSLPASNLITDSAGDLFGTTTFSGPSSDYGSLFEITKTAGGYASTPVILTQITTGLVPDGGVVADAAGNLFGTTSRGGANNDGTVYEVAKTPTGYASAPILIATFNGTNGASPQAGLITDAAGDLFGTTNIGGANNDGTVFEIAKTPSGYGAVTTLVSFNASDLYPQAALIADAAGNLFGTTAGGGQTGAGGPGTVFELAKTATGYASTPTPLLSFTGADGYGPLDSLIADAAGDLFGTTSSNGAFGGGTVFEIAKTATGYASTPIVLANFNGPNGQNPYGSLIADYAGNLFGTTYGGGANRDGTVFEIAKTAGGYGALTTVASFNLTNGEEPQGGLIADAAGNLYGTTVAGGATGSTGTVFEITGSGFQVAPAPGPPNNFLITDQTAGTNTTATGQAYTGPVAGLTRELTLQTSHQVTVTANTPDVFILVGSQGQPDPIVAGINVSQANGNNVLDSYANSSFLRDGTGTDQNYLDARGLTQNQWDTVANFHSGDNITLWGVTPADFKLDWIGDTQGATGFTGLTGVFVPTSATQHEAAVTLAGFKMADLTDGKLAITYDTINGTPYASIHAT